MISIAHRLSYSFPGVLVFPPSKGLVCLVLGGREEKRPPTTRDKRPPLFPVEVENSRGFTWCDNILRNQIRISNSYEFEVHFSCAHRCLGSSITVTWVLSLVCLADMHPLPACALRTIQIVLMSAWAGCNAG